MREMKGTWTNMKIFTAECHRHMIGGDIEIILFDGANPVNTRVYASSPP